VCRGYIGGTLGVCRGYVGGMCIMGPYRGYMGGTWGVLRSKVVPVRFEQSLGTPCLFTERRGHYEHG